MRPREIRLLSLKKAKKKRRLPKKIKKKPFATSQMMKATLISKLWVCTTGLLQN